MPSVRRVSFVLIRSGGVFASLHPCCLAPLKMPIGQFIYARPSFESKLSTVSVKTKTPYGVLVFYLIVELAGVEPASRQGDHMLSTCLFLLNCRDMSAAERPNISLVPVFLAVQPEQSSGQPRIACASLSGWIRALPPGRRLVTTPVP